MSAAISAPARAHHDSPGTGVTASAVQPGVPTTLAGVETQLVADGDRVRIAPALELGLGWRGLQLVARLPGYSHLSAPEMGVDVPSVSATWAWNAGDTDGLWLAAGGRQRGPSWAVGRKLQGLAFGTDALVVVGTRSRRYALDVAALASLGLDYGLPLGVAASYSVSAYWSALSWLQLGGVASLDGTVSLRGDPSPRLRAGLVPSVVIRPLPWALVEVFAGPALGVRGESRMGARVIVLPAALFD